MNIKLKQKLISASNRDPEILCEKDKKEETLGSDPRWLKELGLEKSDLIRLERLGLALKARYEVHREDKKDITGIHRTRWIIYKEALNENDPEV